MRITEIKYNLPIPISKDKGIYWIATKDFGISVLVDGLWENFKFEEGTKTDLGSVPKRLQGIVNNGSGDDVALAIYLCHDNGYATHKRRRAWYDELLKVGLGSSSVIMDAWDSCLAWFAVHVGGAGPWKKRDMKFGYSHTPMEPKPLYGLETQWKVR
jgi:hypothetical protein